MSDMTCWEIFFDAHAPIYEQNEFTKNTLEEVDFLLEELKIPEGGSVLDIGCGTGRHSIELAKRGFSVTGLDLSSEMLSQAEKAARKAGVQVEWIRADASHFSLPKQYDAAICLCEGAFGLLSLVDDPIEQPLKILRNISRSLKPKAKFVLTALNGAAMIRRYQDKDVAKGRFDPMALVQSESCSPREELPAIPVRERGFIPTELDLLCRMAGLTTIHSWGGTAGNWRRGVLSLDEMEIMIVAQKTTEPPAS